MATRTARTTVSAAVWRNVHRDSDAGLHVEFDVTIDGIGAAADDGLGSDPHRLRELAAVAEATADELGEARARRRIRRGAGCRAPDGFIKKWSPAQEYWAGALLSV
jgi:hypothetical protein